MLFSVAMSALTPLPITPEREAFEAWLLTQRPGRGYSTMRNAQRPDEYAFMPTKLAWSAWQYQRSLFLPPSERANP